MESVAVLCSGGLDSAVLAAEEARACEVHPIYVRSGLAWEAGELELIYRLLAGPPYATSVAPLAIVSADVRDVYPPRHWSLEGSPPAYDTDDKEVYLPGRNLLLLSKAAVLCASRGIGRIAVGPLAGNPFPDATPEFFEAMGRALSLGLAHRIRVDAPFALLRKADVIRLGARLGVPFELTMSCMNPRKGSHCGVCSKCRERRDGFEAAGIGDPAAYRRPAPRNEKFKMKNSK